MNIEITAKFSFFYEVEYAIIVNRNRKTISC